MELDFSKPLELVCDGTEVVLGRDRSFLDVRRADGKYFTDAQHPSHAQEIIWINRDGRWHSGPTGPQIVRNSAVIEFSKVKQWPLGTRVTKTKGSSWTGKVVGYYSTSLTPEGVCVESENEPGSVQIYPVAAMRIVGDEE